MDQLQGLFCRTWKYILLLKFRRWILQALRSCFTNKRNIKQIKCLCLQAKNMQKMVRHLERNPSLVSHERIHHDLKKHSRPSWSVDGRRMTSRWTFPLSQRYTTEPWEACGILGELLVTSTFPGHLRSDPAAWHEIVHTDLYSGLLSLLESLYNLVILDPTSTWWARI